MTCVISEQGNYPYPLQNHREYLSQADNGINKIMKTLISPCGTNGYRESQEKSIFLVHQCNFWAYIRAISLKLSIPISVQHAFFLCCSYKVLSPLFPAHNGQTSGFSPLGFFDSLEESQSRHLNWWQGIACLYKVNTLFSAKIIFALADQTAQKI